MKQRWPLQCLVWVGLNSASCQRERQRNCSKSDCWMMICKKSKLFWGDSAAKAMGKSLHSSLCWLHSVGFLSFLSSQCTRQLARAFSVIENEIKTLPSLQFLLFPPFIILCVLLDSKEENKKENRWKMQRKEVLCHGTQEAAIFVSCEWLPLPSLSLVKGSHSSNFVSERLLGRKMMILQIWYL